MDPQAIALSLISHTNAGKTTLARTLLARSVGEVRDAAHVTQEATAYPMIATAQGDQLLLWDTPGFGDSARLVRRLRQQGNPIGWFMSQVWDRLRDQTFWLNQVAVRNTREQADVVLYLVNAAESPQDAGYLEPELAVLQWIGKPVIVLLNHTGAPQDGAAQAQDEDRWRTALRSWPEVRAVLTLDAFARCWVQEFTLFAQVATVLPVSRRAAFDRLAAAWQDRRMEQFGQALQTLALPVAQAACDSEPLPAGSLRGKALALAGLGGGKADGAAAGAMDALAARLQRAQQAALQEVIAIHGLQGQAAAEVLEHLARDVTLDAPLDERKAALMGGAVSGALSGVAADLATGGVSLGVGMLTGAVLGAFGGAGIARGFNTLRRKSQTVLRWDAAFLRQQVGSALLQYLAVAHYGRGRGDWQATKAPAIWREVVDKTLADHQDALEQVWDRREDGGDAQGLLQQLALLMMDLAWAVLDVLYPQALAQLPAREPPPGGR